MSIFDPVNRAEREHAADQARIVDLRSQVESLRQRKKADQDFDTLDRIDGQLADVERRLRLAEGVAESSAARLADAREKAEAMRADAAYAAAERQAKADEKIVRDIELLARKIADKRDELAASISATAKANANRGARPHIANAEERVRKLPARTVPAVTRREWGWIDAKGGRPSQLRDDGKGKLVPDDGRPYEWREIEVTVATERFEPATMPESFLSAFKLVDIAGRPL